MVLIVQPLVESDDGIRRVRSALCAAHRFIEGPARIVLAVEPAEIGCALRERGETLRAEEFLRTRLPVRKNESHEVQPLRPSREDLDVRDGIVLPAVGEPLGFVHASRRDRIHNVVVYLPAEARGNLRDERGTEIDYRRQGLADRQFAIR